MEYPKPEKLSEFATRAFPLRISSLPWFTQCNWRTIVPLYNVAESDGGNDAAQEGTAIHQLIGDWYDNGMDTEGAIEGITASIGRFPFADLETNVFPYFRRYAADPRNQTKPIIYEKEITLIFDPPKESEAITTEPIVLIGHVDQVREDRSILYVWDTKLSGWPASQLVHSYGMQLMFYALAAKEYLEHDVEIGGLILPKIYGLKKNEGIISPEGVFASTPYAMSHAQVWVDDLIRQIVQTRAGHPRKTMSSICTYCSVGGPQLCARLYKRKIESIRG